MEKNFLLKFGSSTTMLQYAHTLYIWIKRIILDTNCHLKILHFHFSCLTDCTDICKPPRGSGRWIIIIEKKDQKVKEIVLKYICLLYSLHFLQFRLKVQYKNHCTQLFCTVNPFTLNCCTVNNFTLQCCTIKDCTLHCCTVNHCTLQCSTVNHCTL